MTEKEYVSIETIKETIDFLESAEKSAELDDNYETHDAGYYASLHGQICGKVSAVISMLKSRYSYINNLPN